MSGESHEAQQLLDRLTEIARLIEQHEAVLWQLKHERFRLRVELAQTGYQAPEPQQDWLR
jgi:hypothetical protein